MDRLHRAVDAMTAPIARAHGGKLACRRGCSGCCVDDITVFAVEAEAIVRAHGALLENEEPHPAGACAFLDAEGGCRIYAERPYVCRTQGLPLRWIEDDHEARDVCALNLVGERIEDLPPSACWTIGPVENKLIELQRDGRRVTLRSLFRKS
ncbi:MAG: YkgJ family cysteine cluster protein [Polyangiales bacterium]